MILILTDYILYELNESEMDEMKKKKNEWKRMNLFLNLLFIKLNYERVPFAAILIQSPGFTVNLHLIRRSFRLPGSSSGTVQSKTDAWLVKQKIERR
jgi:hypothetical protein